MKRHLLKVIKRYNHKDIKGNKFHKKSRVKGLNLAAVGEQKVLKNVLE